MNFNRLKKPVITYLEWEDAISEHSWFTVQEMERWVEKECSTVKQIGWILHEDKEFIFMASRFIPGIDSSVDTWGNIQKIPKTWIRKRKVFKP